MPSSKGWFPVSPKVTKPKVPDDVKELLQRKANYLIENDLKPKHLKPEPKDNDFNYLVEIFSKWYRNYFYFCGKYNCPSPRAIFPSFETKFARMEYTNDGTYNLSYMRYTGQWWEIYNNLELEQCLEIISKEPYFIP